MKPQDVTNTPGEHAIFMVFTLREGDDAAATVKDLCGGFSVVARSMRTRFSASNTSCVMAFGADAWGRLFPEQGRPKELAVFQEIRDRKSTRLNSSH